jgi:hypothetical protein
LTSFYGFRCLYLTFLTSSNSFKIFIQEILIIGTSILFSLWILLLGSIFSGLWFKDLLVGAGSSFFGDSIYISSFHYIMDYEYISWHIKILPLVGTIFGMGLAFAWNKLFLLYLEKSKYNSIFLIKYKNDIGSMFLYLVVKIKVFLTYKWFLDYVLNNYFGIFILKHSYETFYKILDKGIFEVLIINGFSFSVVKLSRQVVINQIGYVYSILCLIFLCYIFFVSLSFFF